MLIEGLISCELFREGSTPGKTSTSSELASLVLIRRNLEQQSLFTPRAFILPFILEEVNDANLDCRRQQHLLRIP